MDILLTEKDDATNTITAQLGNAGAKSVESVGAELWFPPGFCARPSAVSEGADPAAQALILKNSEHDIIIGTRDNRNNDKYAELKEGETSVFAAGKDGKGAAAIFLKESGDVTMSTSTTGKTDGSGLTQTLGPKGFDVNTPYGHLHLGEDKLELFHHSGARITMFGVGGLPIPGVKSQIMIDADMITINGSVVNLGKSSTGAPRSQVAYSLIPNVGPAPNPTTPAITTLSASNNVFVNGI